MTDNANGPDDGHSERVSDASVRLSVPEMDCPSCAGKVDRSLQRADGVIKTALQPTTGTATVAYNPDRASTEDVVAAVESAGYEVVNDESGSDDEATSVEVAPPSETWTGPRAIKTWIGAALVTLGLLVEFVLTGQNLIVVRLLTYPLTLADVLFLILSALSS